MSSNPYTKKSKHHFWKSGVVQASPFNLENLINTHFSLNHQTRIATAGSCFAQHISKHLKKKNYNIIDEEPAPPGLKQSLHSEYGYNLYSARYGNIYTTKQLAQLSLECSTKPIFDIQEVNGRFYDMLRPSIQPEGFESLQETKDQRKNHIRQTRKVFQKMDIFIFTLGLTECWINNKTKTVYPTAPGTNAGIYDSDRHIFHNLEIGEMKQDFSIFQDNVAKIRGNTDYRTILTVSPVPLTATASAQHILLANTLSKAKLRALAGELCKQNDIAYFPSYEIITNPRFHSASYSDNLRSVRPEAVAAVLEQFDAHFALQSKANSNLRATHQIQNDDTQCDEVLLEAFNNQ